MKKIYWVLVIVFISIIIALGPFFTLTKEPVREYKVAYMGSPVISPYWEKLGISINKIGEEKNVLIDDYTTRSREYESRSEMIKMIVKEEYDAILFGAGGEDNLTEYFLKQLPYLNTPIFTIDTRIESEKVKGFVGLSNYASGEVIGEYISNNIGDKEVLIVSANSIHEPSIDRVEGSKKVFEDKGISFNIIDVNSVTWDKELVKIPVREEFEKENNYGAVFVVWDEAIILARDVVENITSKKIIYVGFDGLDFVLDEISRDKIDATVMQSTDLLAATSLDQIVSYLNNEQSKKEILIPGILITKKNVGEFIDRV